MAADDATATIGPVTTQDAPNGNGAPAVKQDSEGLEYEVGFETPFGKLEFEFEPKSRKELKDIARRAKAERNAAKAAQEAARKAARRAEQSAQAGRGRGGSLLTVLLVLAIIGAAVAVAWWLFANPRDDEVDDAIPPDLREAKDELRAEQDAPRGLGARLRDAVRAGRRASREAQEREQRRFEELARQQ